MLLIWGLVSVLWSYTVLLGIFCWLGRQISHILNRCAGKTGEKKITLYQRCCPSDYIRHKLYELIIIFERRHGGKYLFYGGAPFLPVLSSPALLSNDLFFTGFSSSHPSLSRVFILHLKLEAVRFPISCIGVHTRLV